MTYDYQFHINGLKGIKLYLQNLMLTTNYEGMGETDAKEIGETIDAAIEALEKQIPKKPVGDLHSVPHHRCPNCKKAIRIYVDAPYNPFCCFCGQALNWSDDE